MKNKIHIAHLGLQKELAPSCTFPLLVPFLPHQPLCSSSATTSMHPPQGLWTCLKWSLLLYLQAYSSCWFQVSDQVSCPQWGPPWPPCLKLLFFLWEPNLYFFKYWSMYCFTYLLSLSPTRDPEYLKRSPQRWGLWLSHKIMMPSQHQAQYMAGLSKYLLNEQIPIWQLGKIRVRETIYSWLRWNLMPRTRALNSLQVSLQRTHHLVGGRALSNSAWNWAVTLWEWELNKP